MSEIVRNVNKQFGEFTDMAKNIPVAGKFMTEQLPVVGSVISCINKGLKVLIDKEDDEVIDKIVKMTYHYDYGKKLQDAIMQAILILLDDG